MRNITSLLLLSTAWALTLHAGDASSTAAAAVTPLSETDPRGLTAAEVAQLPPLMQRCITQLAEVKTEREDTFADNILKSPEYQAFHRKKTAARSLEVAGVSALVAAGAKVLYDTVSPYIAGFVGDNYPTLAEKADTLSATYLPDSPLVFPITAISVSALAAALYVRQALSKPAQLDAKTLAIIQDFDVSRNGRLDTEQQHFGILYDTLLVEKDDLNLLAGLLPRLQQALADINTQIIGESAPHGDKAQQYTELSAKAKTLNDLIVKVKVISDAHQAAQQSKAVAVQQTADLETRPVEKRRRTRVPTLLTALGLGAAGKTTGSLTRSAAFGSSSMPDSVSLLALCGGAAVLSAGSLEEAVTKNFHHQLRKALRESENAKFKKLSKDMEEFTIEQLSAHQDDVRVISQGIDLNGLNAEQIRAKLNAGKARQFAKSDDVSALLQHYEEMTLAARQLIKFHTERTSQK